MFSMILFLRCV